MSNANKPYLKSWAFRWMIVLELWNISLLVALVWARPYFDDDCLWRHLVHLFVIIMLLAPLGWLYDRFWWKRDDYRHEPALTRGCLPVITGFAFLLVVVGVVSLAIRFAMPSCELLPFDFNSGHSMESSAIGASHHSCHHPFFA